MSKKKKRSTTCAFFPPKSNFVGCPPSSTVQVSLPGYASLGGRKGSQHVDLSNQECLSLTLSEADPDASLRTSHLFLRWSLKTPVGTRWTETCRDRQPKMGVTSSPSPLWAPAASSCRGFRGLTECAPQKIPTARGGRYLHVTPVSHLVRGCCWGGRSVPSASACYLAGRAGQHAVARAVTQGLPGGSSPALGVEA